MLTSSNLIIYYLSVRFYVLFFLYKKFTLFSTKKKNSHSQNDKLVQIDRFYF